MSNRNIITLLEKPHRQRQKLANKTRDTIPDKEIREYKRGIKLIYAILHEIQNSREEKLSITHICNKTFVCYSQIKTVIPKMIEAELVELETNQKYFGKKRQIKQLFKASEKGKLLMSKVEQLEQILPALYLPISNYNRRQPHQNARSYNIRDQQKQQF